MGRSPRPRPKRLATKLKAVRTRLGLTQTELVEQLKQRTLYPGHISEYERGEREPPYLVLLRYARLVGVSTDVLIDDELELPESLPTERRKPVDYVRPK